MPVTREEAQTRREIAAERFAEHNRQSCMMCGAVGEDMRTIVVSSGWEMSALVEELIDLAEVDSPLQGRGYYCRVCKSCRGDYLRSMKFWAQACRRKRGKALTNDGAVISGAQVGPGTEFSVPVLQGGFVTWLREDDYEKYIDSQVVELVE